MQLPAVVAFVAQLYPIIVFSTPVVIASPATYPIIQLAPPVVIAAPVLYPTATFVFTPSCTFKAFLPIATL